MAQEYQVLARKYRPQSFDEVVGQSPIATTLKNAILTSRVAHAYLFSGTRGVGKTSMARILAKSLNCLNSPQATVNPCQECDACVNISQGTDVDVLEIDGASNRGIDEIRNIREGVGYSPARSRFKIYIIDEVHMLTIQAFNALLKTLEEPPPHVKFIFATTQAYDLPETIHSRCQRFDFRRIFENDMVLRLAQICKEEGVSYEEPVLSTIAIISTGGMRDAQSTLDQLISSSPEPLLTLKHLEDLMGWVQQSDLYEFVEALVRGETSNSLRLLSKIYERGNDLGDFLGQLIQKFRACMLYAYMENAETPTFSGEDIAFLQKITQNTSKDFFLYATQVLLETQNKIKHQLQPRILVETALIKLSQSSRMLPLATIVERIQGLERRLMEKIGPLPPPVMVTPLVRTSSSEGGEVLYATPATTPSFFGEKSEESGEKAEEKEEKEKNVGGEFEEKNKENASSEVEFKIPTVETLVSDFKLKELWPQIVERVKQRKTSVGVFLSEGEFLGCDEMRILVGFRPLFAFHCDQLEEPEKKQFILEAVWEFTEQKFEVKFIKIEESEQTKTKNTLTESDLMDHKDVQKILKVFQGRIVKVEK